MFNANGPEPGLTNQSVHVRGCGFLDRQSHKHIKIPGVVRVNPSRMTNPIAQDEAAQAT